MKRTPLRRKTRLRTRTPMRRGGRIKPKASKRDWQPLWDYAAEVGRCEFPGCKGKWPAVSPHHVRTRGAGGTDVFRGPKRNIVVLCNWQIAVLPGERYASLVKGHHTMAQEGLLKITKAADGRWAFQAYWRGEKWGEQAFGVDTNDSTGLESNQKD